MMSIFFIQEDDVFTTTGMNYDKCDLLTIYQQIQLYIEGTLDTNVCQKGGFLAKSVPKLVSS